MYRMTLLPNELIDVYLRGLKPGELKVLLVVVRHTMEYTKDFHLKTKLKRVWISNSQISRLTGLSRRAVSKAIIDLLDKKLITISDGNGNPITSSNQIGRKGKKFFGQNIRAINRQVRFEKRDQLTWAIIYEKSMDDLNEKD